jgi:cytoplasmic iron level regulating protein YaaA (DUF328/UPF0246 family)
MLILLPPSETKRDGGAFPSLSEGGLEELSFPGLNPVRKKVAAALTSLSRQPAEALEVLKLSTKQSNEVVRNREVLTSPGMPAIDRYTGVLYDGLAASNLPDAAREFLRDNIVIQSALLGPVGALDPIPAYRLSFDSRLPRLAAGTLKKAWADAGAKALAGRIAGGTRGGASGAVAGELESAESGGAQLVLDLRSEGYSALSPVAPAPETVYLRVVTKGENGQLKALNHFNKKGKGEFVRALAKNAAVTSSISTVDELIAWASTMGLVLERGADATADWPTELNLVVSGTVAKLC